METYSGPHQSNRGKRLARRNRTIIRSAGDQESIGPIGVAAQSSERISSPISPPPWSQAGVEVSGVRLRVLSLAIRLPVRTLGENVGMSPANRKACIESGRAAAHSRRTGVGKATSGP